MQKKFFTNLTLLILLNLLVKPFAIFGIDLTIQNRVGAENYGTLSYVIESPHEKGVLWTGSDDGLVHMSKDAGKTWANVTPKNAPKWMMWNCIETDPFKKGTAYIVGTKYKLDDFTPYIFKTREQLQPSTFDCKTLWMKIYCQKSNNPNVS